MARDRFNPRSPCGERRGRPDAGHRAAEFQPTLPLRGATHWLARVLVHRPVSTHAPLAGSDARVRHWPLVRGRVSTHAPLAGSDTPIRASTGLRHGFQPTLPLRGATLTSSGRSSLHMFQPTLPLRGATLSTAQVASSFEFQPTLPLRGATSEAVCDLCDLFSFNPRSPCGERREQAGIEARTRSVSTHAPLAGSDAMCAEIAGETSAFQPTLPLRGATPCTAVVQRRYPVSTHAPLAGSDGDVLL